MAKELILKNLQKTSPKSVPNPTDSALTAFNMIVIAYKEYQQVVEMEKTKREAIAAWKEVKLTSLNNQKQFLHTYLENTFQERRYVIEEMFKRLDEGIANDNIHLVNQAMDKIVSIVKTSPLQEAEKILLAMNDPSIETIEF